MDDDGSSERDGGFESLWDALGRAKQDVGVAVGHGVEGVRNWAEERWLPIRIVVLGGFSWATSLLFGWLVGRVVGVGSWLTSAFIGTTTSIQILLFFAVYMFHSLSQTKFLLDIKTNLWSMAQDDHSKVRTDGGGSDEIWLPAGAISGILAGVAIGWSFGIEGVFVGATVGWVLGDEYDRWFDEKFMGTGYPTREEERHSE